MIKKIRKLPIKLRYIFIASFIVGTIFLLQYLAQLAMQDKFDQFSVDFQLPSIYGDLLIWVFVSFFINQYSVPFISKIKNASFLEYLLQLFISLFISSFVALMARVLTHSMVYLYRDQWFSIFDGHSLQGTVTTVFTEFVVYWIIAIIFFSIEYYTEFNKQRIELVKMENELNNAQLSALKMQLNPHFLFNTLHTISSLMGKNDLGQKVLSRLGMLLRTMLEQNNKHRVTVHEEIEYIKSYLYIEEVRFQDRLKVEFIVAEELEKFLVPNLILQPLVENAIKHGFSKRTDRGEIIIQISKENDFIRLDVTDDGKGVKDLKKIFNKPGVGIKNTRERLKQMYRENFEFNIDSSYNKGFKARIKIPAELEQNED